MEKVLQNFEGHKIQFQPIETHLEMDALAVKLKDEANVCELVNCIRI